MESKKNEVIESNTVYTRMGERVPGNEERLYIKRQREGLTG